MDKNAQLRVDWTGRWAVGKREHSAVVGSTMPREQMKDEGWPCAGCFSIRQ